MMRPMSSPNTWTKCPLSRRIGHPAKRHLAVPTRKARIHSQRYLLDGATCSRIKRTSGSARLVAAGMIRNISNVRRARHPDLGKRRRLPLRTRKVVSPAREPSGLVALPLPLRQLQALALQPRVRLVQVAFYFPALLRLLRHRLVLPSVLVPPLLCLLQPLALEVSSLVQMSRRHHVHLLAQADSRLVRLSSPLQRIPNMKLQIIPPKVMCSRLEVRLSQLQWMRPRPRRHLSALRRAARRRRTRRRLVDFLSSLPLLRRLQREKSNLLSLQLEYSKRMINPRQRLTSLPHLSQVLPSQRQSL